MRKHLFLIALICSIFVACGPKPELPTVTTNSVSEVTDTTALCVGAVVNDGNADITAKGFCWSTEQNPTLENNTVMTVTTREEAADDFFTATLSGLTAATEYYVRAYATNSEGTAYGENINFVTLEEENSDDNTGDDNTGDDNTGDDNTGDDNTDDDNDSEIVIELPTLITSDVTEITETTAMISCEVTNDGGASVTSRGVCWSISENPTIEDTHTNDGEGIGVFTSTMTNLTPNTTYYVRAYATNSEGTSYGNEMNFTTLEEIILELPTITDVTISEVTSNTSIISAEVLTDGGAEVTERGFYWGEKSSVEPNRVNVGEGLGNFTYQLTGLNGGTEYYVYSFAKNSVGEVVGTIAYFTTIENTPEIEYVDMGFPSGVKWATCNFGATTPEGYGEYYAWGEIETKEEYTWQNGNCLTYGKELGDISGNPEYDVVAAEWGGSWRSPRLEDMYELVTLCDWIWNGKGFNVVSRINGSYIFLPAAGFMNTLAANAAGTEGPLDQGTWGYYWTSTPYSEEVEGGTNTNKRACFLQFGSGGYMTDQGLRYNGFSIRPVRD